MFLEEADPLQMKTADRKHIDPGPVGTRSVVLTPHYLTTNQKKNVHKLIMPSSLNHYYKTPDYPVQDRTHTVLRALVYCGPLCLAKQ